MYYTPIRKTFLSGRLQYAKIFIRSIVTFASQTMLLRLIPVNFGTSLSLNNITRKRKKRIKLSKSAKKMAADAEG